MKMSKELELFLVFTKIGAFTVGGGYVMVMFLKDELCGRGWISEEEFPDILALAQSAPGVLAVNFSVFAGHKVAGRKGSILAVLGSCLAPFVFILAIAIFFAQFKDLPVVQQIFKGMRPAVVGLIVAPTIKLARASNKRWWAWVISAAVACLIAFLNFSPLYIMLVTIVVSVSVSWWLEKKGRVK